MNVFLKHIFCFFLVIAWTRTAYAVPVTYFPAAPYDIACDNIVNETALFDALQKWVKDCNAELAQLEKIQEEKIIQSVCNMDEAPFFHNLQDTESKQTLEMLVQPVLKNWFKPEDTAKLSSSQQKVLALLSRYGLVPQSEEGMSFLALDYACLYKQLQLSPDARSFIAILTAQPLSNEALMREDGVLYYGQNAFAKWAVALENFLRANPENSYAPYALQRYHLWIQYLLFYGLGNDENGTLTSTWVNWKWLKDFLGDITKEYPDTLTGSLILDFLGKVEANGLKVPQDFKQNMTKKIDSTFVLFKQNNSAPNESFQPLYFEGNGNINANILFLSGLIVKTGLFPEKLCMQRPKNLSGFWDTSWIIML